MTAGQILLDDLNLNASVFQHLGEVVRNLAAAHQHGGFDRIIGKSDLAEKLGCLRSGCHKGNFIALLQAEASARDDDIVSALYCTDQDAAVKTRSNLVYLHIVKHRVIRNDKFHQLHAALCKCVDLNDRRELQQSGNLGSCCQLRVDRHGQVQLLPDILYFVRVLRITDSRNGVAVTGFFCDQAAEHIQLIGVGGCDQKVRFFDSGLNLHLVNRTVPLYSHHIDVIGHRAELGAVLVDHGDIMSLII